MRTPIIADLSIDWDFFVREDPKWDWGHAEKEESALYEQLLWDIRYRSSPFDIFEETDPAKHADVLPEDFLHELLVSKRCALLPRSRKIADTIGFAESHKAAYDFFRRSKAPGMLINIDAHHDVFTDADRPLNCGNWVSHLHREWPKTEFVQVYPTWKDTATELPEEGEPPLPVPLRIHKWKEWRTGPSLAHIRVRNIFFCRSGVWTPPHLDRGYMALAEELLAVAQTPHEAVKILDRMIVRSHPTHEEHLASVAVARAEYEKLMEKNREFFAAAKDRRERRRAETESSPT